MCEYICFQCSFLELRGIYHVWIMTHPRAKDGYVTIPIKAWVNAPDKILTNMESKPNRENLQRISGKYETNFLGFHSTTMLFSLCLSTHFTCLCNLIYSFCVFEPVSDNHWLFYRTREPKCLSSNLSDRKWTFLYIFIKNIWHTMKLPYLNWGLYNHHSIFISKNFKQSKKKLHTQQWSLSCFSITVSSHPALE